MIRWLVLLPVFLVDVNAQACPTIVPHSAWGSSETPCKTRFIAPVEYVVIHHTAGDFCYNRQSCIAQVRKVFQAASANKWCDVGFHFFIGEDGMVYEGRGWFIIGAHAVGYNYKSIGIAFIGNFKNRPPSPQALNTARNLIKCGVAKKYIRVYYRLKAHRKLNPTTCPGDSLYRVIEKWPQF